MPERIKILEGSIDKQIAEVREKMFQAYATDGCDISMVASLMRACYGKGLVDVLIDPEGARRFTTEHGYKIPERGSRF